MKSEVNKLRADVERLAGASPAAMKPPSDVPAETWARMLGILAGLPPEAFAPWESLEHVAEWVEEQNPDVLNEYPDPVINAWLQAVGACPDASKVTDEALRAMIRNGGRLPADFVDKPGDGGKGGVSNTYTPDGPQAGDGPQAAGG